MPVLYEVCGWTHCRQHVAHGAPGGIHRHYSVKHNGRYPPDKGYESDDGPVDEDAALLDRIFWAAAEGRHDAEDEEMVEAAVPGGRVFEEERFPAAGWACDSDGQWLEEQTPEARRDQVVDPEDPFAPFDDERQYGWADRIAKYRMSRSQVDSHMRRHAEQEPTAPAFTNFAQYRKAVDDIEHGSEWATWRSQTFKAAPTDLPADALQLYPFLNDVQTFYYRNTDLVLRDLIRNPAFVGRQAYAPVRHRLPDGDFITEPHTARNAWAFQEKLDVGTTQVRLTIASDATQCSLASGNASLHPVYLSTSLNDASLIREDRGALVVVGFIPILKTHETASGAREMFARCEAKPKELGNGAGTPRTSASSAAHRALGAEHARSKGLHMEVPYYERFGINGHALIISDLLHQLTKGIFKDWTLDNLIKVYLKNAAGGGKPYDSVMKEIARRLEVLPPFGNLRRFKDGIDFTNWTGKDSKSLMAIISAALWDLSWGEEGSEGFKTALDEVTQSITLVVVTYFYAAGLESTATDREMQAEAMRLYMEVIRYAFEDERAEKGFNWARLHSMFHYIEWTELNGTAPHSDTSHYETAHIKAVKLPYRASNRCNAIVQILRANTRRDCLASLRGELELEGVIATARPMPPPVYREALTTLPGRGGEFDINFLKHKPSADPAVSTDREKRLRLFELAEHRQLPGLVEATSDFLSTYLNIPDFQFIGRVEVHTIASASFPVYGKPAYLSNDTCKLMTQRIYATSDYVYRGEVGSVRGPRHDTVLVRGSRFAELGGESFAAYDVFRARLFFTVGYRGRRLELCLGEVYEKVSAQYVASAVTALMHPVITLQDPQHPASRSIMQPVVHPVDVGEDPKFRVFLVSDILRAVHLQPIFGRQGVPRDLHFTETLDRWRGSYAVGLFTDQHIFRLLFRPDARAFLNAIPRE
ncbi:hypothetical protein P7C70_g1498, partial [Phenoliferia sp. Uapishka_3]